MPKPRGNGPWNIRQSPNSFAITATGAFAPRQTLAAREDVERREGRILVGALPADDRQFGGKAAVMTRRVLCMLNKSEKAFRRFQKGARQGDVF